MSVYIHNHIYVCITLIQCLLVPAVYRHIIAVALGNEVLVYDACSGVQLRRLCGHVESVASVAFAVRDSDSCFLLSGGWDNRLILWDVVSGGPVVCVRDAHRASISAVALNAHLAVSCSWDKDIKVWLLAHLHLGAKEGGGHFDLGAKEGGHEEVREVTTLRGHAFQVNAVVISGDGRVLASGSSDNCIKVSRPVHSTL